MKKRTFEILSDQSENDVMSKLFNAFIMTLILLNVTAVILETVKSLATTYKNIFYYFELFSVVIFTIEYLLRIWSCTIIPKYNHPIMGRLKFIISPISLIDLLAIIPFYLPMFIKLDLRGLRALRLFRMFRIFKMGRYLESLKMIGFVFKSKKEQIILAVITMLLLLLFSSSLLYVVESDAQPDAFGSIPSAMWWGTAALTTVGYGDVYPVTAVGRILGAIIAIMGIGMFALPAGILASGFTDALQHKIHSSKINALNKAVDLANRLKNSPNDIKKDVLLLLESMIDIDGIRDESEEDLLKQVEEIFKNKNKE